MSTETKKYKNIKWENWVVLILTGLAETVLSGLIMSTTIFYQFLLVKFGRSASDTALTISISSFLRQLSSPFAAILINHFGFRNVAMGGGLLLSASFIVTAFAPFLWVVYISFGVMQGIGSSVFTVARQTATQVTFDKSRAKANALHNAVCWGIGGLYLPGVLTFIHAEWGFYGACLLLSGLLLNLLPAGMLFGLLTPPPSPCDKENGSQTDNEKVQCESAKGNGREMSYGVKESNENNSNAEEIIPMKDHSKTGSQDEHLQQIQKATSEENNEDRSCVFGFIQRVMKLTGLSVLKNKTLAMFCVLSLVFTYFQQSTTVLLSGMVYEKGFKKSELVLMISISSFIEMGSRILFGVVLDLGRIQRHRMVLYVLLVLSGGVFAIFLPIIPGVIPTIILYVAMGNCVGISYSQYATVLVDLVVKADIASAIGVGYFILGIGNIIGPAVGAAVTESTGTYFTIFHLSGAIMATAALLFLIIFKLCCKGN